MQKRIIKRMFETVFVVLLALYLSACGAFDKHSSNSSGGEEEDAAVIELPPFNISCLPLAVTGSGGGYGSFTFDANGDLLFVVNDVDEIRLLDRETCTVTTVATGVSGGNTLIGMTHQNPIYVGDASDNIYTVDQSTGSSTLLTTVSGDEINGLVIAPGTFGAYGGQLIVAGNSGGIYAVDQSQVSPTAVFIVDIGGSASDLIFGSDGTLYVAAEDDNRIVTVTAAGVVADFVTGLSSPDGLAIDNAGGRLFVADSGDDTAKQVTIPGGVVSTLTSVDFDSGFWPSPIVYDSAGDILLMGSGESELTIVAYD